MQSEQAVADRVGISREDCLRMRRKMRKGDHWEVEPDVGVVFTDSGVEALRRMLKLPALEVPKKEGGPADAVAVKVDFPNKQMILALVGGANVRCRVRGAEMYVVGMTFRAVHVQDDLWEEERAPRFRGRV